MFDPHVLAYWEKGSEIVNHGYKINVKEHILGVFKLEQKIQKLLTC